MHYLKQLGYMIQDNMQEICKSVKEDLGRRNEETEFGEVRDDVSEDDSTGVYRTWLSSNSFGHPYEKSIWL